MGKRPANWKVLDISQNSEGKSNTYLNEYGVVVLAAGTNDYSGNAKLGSINSNDVNTFYGALNHILTKIKAASKQRVKRGEASIKVVFNDLYFSGRVYDLLNFENRDTTPNRIGLTLKDYQNALDKIYKKWKNDKYLKLYKFNTRSYNIVTKANCPYTTADNLHYTRFTYTQYGNAFANFLLKNVLKD